jgi:ATP-dependent protease HslVU (ClpYQ) ATPase subunit
VQDVSFDGPDLENKEVVMDRAYVESRLAEILQKEETGRMGFSPR